MQLKQWRDLMNRKVRRCNRLPSAWSMYTLGTDTCGMADMDRVLSLIGDIYEAGARPDHWHVVLKNMADALGSEDATMGGATASQVPMLVSANTDPDYVRSYAEYYHARNPLQLAVMGQPVGRAVLDSMVLEKSQFRAGEFYNDWCMPQGYLNGAAVNLAASGGWRATIMISGKRENDTEEYRVFSALAPHLIRAFQLNQLLHENQAVGHGVMAALAHIDRGALVVDNGGVVRSVNAIADRILGLGDGLHLNAGVLTCSDREENAMLQRSMAACQRGGIGEDVVRAGWGGEWFQRRFRQRGKQHIALCLIGLREVGVVGARQMVQRIC